MLITRKSLKASTPSKLCLVIQLEDGIKVQYPVVSEADAIAKYSDFVQNNPSPSNMEKSDFLVPYDTFLGAI